MLTAVALTFLVNLGGAAFNWIYKKAGRRTTQAVIFALALLAAVYNQYLSNVPSVAEVAEVAVVLFSMAVAFYEVILKQYPIFSGPQK